MSRPFTTELTTNQKAVLDWIREFIQRNGMPPTVREIGRGLGYTSSRSVFDYLKALQRKGYLSRGKLGARSLTVHGAAERVCPPCAGVRVLGRIAAGRPIMAEEVDLGTIAMDRELLRHGESFALRVEGNSMVGAGILDGDWVVVRKQETAADGDIVVALVDGEATVKRLYHEGRRVRLQPANPAHKPLYVTPDQLVVQGKVVAVKRFL